MRTLLLWAAKWRAFIPSWREPRWGQNYRMTLGFPPSCTSAVRTTSRYDPHTYLILGPLVCSSSNEHEHDLETSRPGCKVNYCQVVLPEEEKRKVSITGISHNTLSQSKKAKLILNCWKLTNREKIHTLQMWYFNSMGKRIHLLDGSPQWRK